MGKIYCIFQGDCYVFNGSRKYFYYDILHHKNPILLLEYFSPTYWDIYKMKAM